MAGGTPPPLELSKKPVNYDKEFFGYPINNK